MHGWAPLRTQKRKLFPRFHTLGNDPQPKTTADGEHRLHDRDVVPVVREHKLLAFEGRVQRRDGIEPSTPGSSNLCSTETAVIERILLDEKGRLV